MGIRQAGGEHSHEQCGGTTRYLHTDELGSISAATDENGRIMWQSEHSPFGQQTAEVGLEQHTATYTGKGYVEDAGLYYFNARWYDAELGRFVTLDPARDGSNWYAYVRNNPLGYVDPTGLEDREIIEYIKDAVRPVWNVTKGVGNFIGEVFSEIGKGVSNLLWGSDEHEKKSQEIRETLESVAKENPSNPQANFYTCTIVFNKTGKKLGYDMSIFDRRNAASINELLNDMADQGAHGIQRVSAEEAQNAANQGLFVIASRTSWTGIDGTPAAGNHAGHVAVVIADPTRSAGKIRERGPLVGGGGIRPEEMQKRTVTDAAYQFSFGFTALRPQYFIYTRREE